MGFRHATSSCELPSPVSFGCYAYYLFASELGARVALDMSTLIDTSHDRHKTAIIQLTNPSCRQKPNLKQPSTKS